MISGVTHKGQLFSKCIIIYLSVHVYIKLYDRNIKNYDLNIEEVTAVIRGYLEIGLLFRNCNSISK